MEVNGDATVERVWILCQVLEKIEELHEDMTVCANVQALVWHVHHLRAPHHHARAAFKALMTFHFTDWFIGILILAYYHPHMGSISSPIPNNQPG